jgi:predicted acyl esterase
VPGSTATYTTAPLPKGGLLAGPMAITVWASSSTSDLQLLAELSDVAPDGTETPITRGGVLGSLHDLNRDRSWTDAAGLPVRPFLSLLRDNYVPGGRVTAYEIPLQPKVWEVAPDHRIQLRLSTPAAEQACLTAWRRSSGR